MTRLMSTWAAGAAVTLGAVVLAPAMAETYGTVVSRTAVFAQVARPQRQCIEQQQLVQSPPSGAGGLLGAIVGGVAGNAIGGGAGRALATGAGVIGGALVGNSVEANATPPTSVPVQQCQIVSRAENRLIGYDVVYRYNGQTYTTRMANDPGAPGTALAMNVTPAAAAPVMQSAPEMVEAPPPVVYAPAPPVYAAPVYAPPAYIAPAIGVNLGVGWGGGYRHWR